MVTFREDEENDDSETSSIKKKLSKKRKKELPPSADEVMIWYDAIGYDTMQLCLLSVGW